MIFRYFFMVICVFVSHCNGDYTCLCNYNVETPVYRSADTSAHPIGYMYEFDCKFILSDDNPEWTTIAFEHKIGFVEKTSGTQVQICPGTIPTGDKLPTTTTSTKAAATTTVSTLISSSLPTILPLQTVASLFSKSSSSSSSSSLSSSSSSSSSSFPPSQFLSSTDSFSSSLAYSKSPVPTGPQRTFSVPLSNKSSIATSSASKTSSLPTSLHLLFSPLASSPPSTSSSLHSLSPPLNVLSTSPNSSFSTTTTTTNMLSSEKNEAPSSIAYISVNVSSPIPTTHVSYTLGLSGKTTATLNGHSTTLGNTASNTSSTLIQSAKSEIPSSSYLSSTLYNILRTSELPSISEASLTSESSSEHTAATHSNAYVDSSTKSSSSYSGLSVFPYSPSAETYSTSKTTIIFSNSQITSEMPDISKTSSGVSTSNTSTILVHSSGNSMSSLKTSLPTSSSVKKTTMTPSLTNMNTISTVTENKTHGIIKDRTDLCPYDYLAKSTYNGNTYTYPLFRQYGNFCYELRLELGSWFEGQSDCVKRGGELAIIKNSEVQERLCNLTSSLQHKMDVWIGLHDLYQEGRWEWVDGEKLTQASYNNGILITRVYNDARDCVVIDGSSGVWKNIACQSVLFDNHSHPWICQYRKHLQCWESRDICLDKLHGNMAEFWFEATEHGTQENTTCLHMCVRRRGRKCRNTLVGNIKHEKITRRHTT